MDLLVSYCIGQRASSDVLVDWKEQLENNGNTYLNNGLLTSVIFKKV